MELRNRIGDGGRIFESQKEYAAYVNQVLFGFETMDEYREMLELLISCVHQSYPKILNQR